MPIDLQNLDQRFPIVDPKTGQPTDYFLRLLRGQGSALADGVVEAVDTADEAIAATNALLTRDLIAGAGLTGGGTLAADRTFTVGAGTGITVNADDVALSNTAVTPGSYTNTDLTVDAQGRITAAANGSGGGGGGSWTLAGSWTYSSNVASVDFTGLAGAQEILIIGRLITASSSSALRTAWLSVNNGSSFYTASGDYETVSNTGIESATTSAGGHTSATGNARTTIIHVRNAGLNGVPKHCVSNGSERLFVASTSPVNAVRVGATVGDMTAGSIIVMTR